MAIAFAPDALHSSPIEIAFVAVEFTKRPRAIAFSSVALEILPNAKAYFFDATVLNPVAKEDSPIESMSHCAPVILPARKVALSAYHIIRLPAPETGGGVAMAGNGLGPVNKVLPFSTCSNAKGISVLMPTLPN